MTFTSPFKSDDWFTKTLVVQTVQGNGPAPQTIQNVSLPFGSYLASGEPESIVHDIDTGKVGGAQGTVGPCGVWYLPVAVSVVHGGTGYVVGDRVTAGGATFGVASVLGGGTVTGIGIVDEGLATSDPGTPLSAAGGSGSGLELSIDWETFGIFPLSRTGFSNGLAVGKLPLGGLKAEFENDGSSQYGSVKIKFDKAKSFIDENGDSKPITGRLVMSCPKPDDGHADPNLGGNPPMFVEGNVASQYPLVNSGTVNKAITNWLYDSDSSPPEPTGLNDFQWAQKGHILRSIVYIRENGPPSNC